MDKEPKKSVVECLETLEKLIYAKEDYVYRGQTNVDLDVESAGTRRLIRDSMKDSSFAQYHEEVLLTPTQMDGHGVIDGQKLSGLESAPSFVLYTLNSCRFGMRACQPARPNFPHHKKGKIQ